MIVFLQEVADFVIRRIANGLEPEIICEELMNRCLATDNNMGGLGCDNMTVVLVCFLHNQPYQTLIDKCSSLLKTPEEEEEESQPKIKSIKQHHCDFESED